MQINLITILYFICALLLTLYTAGQLILLFTYWKHRSQIVPTPSVAAWPSVTVQLPIYNERHVVIRLLDAIATLDYPTDKLHIQVLDDSTDDTSLIAARHIHTLRQGGLSIAHIRRHERAGYKAGALAYGLSIVKSELVAMFDADFVPPPDFLRCTVPFFTIDPQLGIVQTRWGHLNPFDNALTLAQTLSIDVHFVIEQTARNRAGWTLSFNGTGGLWRTTCIEAAGGWSDDTLTEDLDLSYRAQLAGWRYLLLPDVVVQGEVPPQLAAYKQQQARWAKGSTQCLVRLIGPVWRSDMTFMQKVMSTQNLCQYMPHPLMLFLLLLTPPLMLDGSLAHLPLAPLSLIGLAPPLLYFVSQKALYPDWKRRVLGFPAVMLLGAGITWNNTLAVLSVLAGRVGEFQRTPKFAQNWQNSAYALRGDWTLWGEVALAIYACWGMILAFHHQPAIVPYLGLYVVAFTGMALQHGREQLQVRRALSANQHFSKSALQHFGE